MLDAEGYTQTKIKKRLFDQRLKESTHLLTLERFKWGIEQQRNHETEQKLKNVEKHVNKNLQGFRWGAV